MARWTYNRYYALVDHSKLEPPLLTQETMTSPVVGKAFSWRLSLLVQETAGPLGDPKHVDGLRAPRGFCVGGLQEHRRHRQDPNQTVALYCVTGAPASQLKAVGETRGLGGQTQTLDSGHVARRRPTPECRLRK